MMVGTRNDKAGDEENNSHTRIAARRNKLTAPSEIGLGGLAARKRSRSSPHSDTGIVRWGFGMFQKFKTMRFG